ADARTLAREPDVPLHRQRRADADRRAIDRGDDRLSHVPGRDRAAWLLPGPVGRRRLAVLVGGLAIEAAPAAREVRAGAERAPGAGDDDRADGVVRVAGGERLRELASH